MARHKRFTDKAGFTRHCWECVHSYDWDEHVGFCDVYVNSVEKYDSPNNCSSIVGGCDHYSDGKEPEPDPDTGGGVRRAPLLQGVPTARGGVDADERVGM